MDRSQLHTVPFDTVDYRNTGNQPVKSQDWLNSKSINGESSKLLSEEETKYPILIACFVCGRTFNPSSLERHVKICQKLAAKQRKIFDSSKQRLEGIEILIETSRRNSPVSPPKDKNVLGSYQNSHSIKGECALRMYSKYVQCPHCYRKFGFKAADRHIKWCESHKLQEAFSPNCTSDIAKERLQARIKYKAPLPIPSKRQSNKLKYSPAFRKHRSLSGSFDRYSDYLGQPIAERKDDHDPFLTSGTSLSSSNTSLSRSFSLQEPMHQSIHPKSIRRSSCISPNSKSHERLDEDLNVICRSDYSLSPDILDKELKYQDNKSKSLGKGVPFLRSRKKMPDYMKSDSLETKYSKKPSLNLKSLSISDPLYGIDPIFTAYLISPDACKQKPSYWFHSEISYNDVNSNLKNHLSDASRVDRNFSRSRQE